MVQIVKYVAYLLGFFLLLHVLVWTKYIISPEEKSTEIERKLSYEEAKKVLKGTINYKDLEYFETKTSVVKITSNGFLTFNYDTLVAEINFFSKDKE